MSELKPCPFCGGEARSIGEGIDWAIRCRQCYAGSVWEYTEAEAIEAWNRRVESKEIAILKRALYLVVGDNFTDYIDDWLCEKYMGEDDDWCDKNCKMGAGNECLFHWAEYELKKEKEAIE